jgi:4-hydroxybenzoyl-CoA thioesterase
MPQRFVREYPILFSHCDPAGIVYFPRLFDLLHTAMEDWFTFGLDERFADFLMKKQLGTPTVSTKADFLAPVRFGDQLRIELGVSRLGRSAIDLRFEAFVGERACLRADHTVCIFSRETHRALPIPDDLRARMEAYLVAPATDAD